MVKVSIFRGNVMLKLEGTKKLLALKGTVNIPLSLIKHVSTSRPRWPYSAIRLGTHLPGVMMAGTMWTRKGKAFYYMRDPQKCVTLTLHDHEYSKVVFQVDDKIEVASQISKALL